MFTEKMRATLRDYSFESHCPQVKIFQKSGIFLEGYGTIKINPYGTLYIEFICLRKENIPVFEWSKRFPEDILNDSQELSLEAFSLDGFKFQSKSFTITIHQLDIFKTSLHHIFLTDINFSMESKNNKDLHYFEFNQIFEFPKNKINKIISTLGTESSSWNEAIIDIAERNLKIRIVNETENSSFISVEGNIAEDMILDCLTFYLGFCSGCLIKPYYSIHVTNNLRTTVLHSVNKTLLNKVFFPAMASNVSSPYHDGEYHYNILRSCIKIYYEEQDIFLSMYAQWKRIWLSSTAIQDIINLTLTTGIEGLLNDIFIPSLKKHMKDDALENDIKKIKNLIKTLEIDPQYKERLQNSISYLKNITPNIALKFLAEKEIINTNEGESWKRLRNEVAHPKVRSIDSVSKYEEKENFFLCLNLFISLVLQTLDYNGPRNLFSSTQASQLILFNAKKLGF